MIAIAALTPSRVIGAKGGIPWHLPEDLKFFKRTTLGHVVLMGRTTFESIGKPLPGRENWVLTRGGPIAGTRIFSDPSQVGELTDGRLLFVIGGAAVYEAFLPRCAELLLTRVHREVEGDRFFPVFEESFQLAETVLQTPDFTVERHVRA